MKTPKTNIYLAYFRTSGTILTQAQKRRVILFMTFAGLFVLNTIIGFPLTVLYSLIGMVTLCVGTALFLTEGSCLSEEELFHKDEEVIENG